MIWFKNLKTAHKLTIAFGVVAFVMVFVGYQGISAANNINSMLDTMYEKDMVGTSAIKDSALTIARIGREIRAAVLSTDAAEMQELNRRIEDYFSKLDEQLATAEKCLVKQEAKERIATAKTDLQQYHAAIREAMQLTLQNTPEANKQALAKVKAAKSISEAVSNNIDAIAVIKDKHAKDAYEESDATYVRLRTSLICIIAAGFAFCLGAGWMIGKLISTPLIAAVGVLEKVAAGDLTAKLDVRTKDEVGQMATALNTATSSMRDALDDVRNSAESMANSAQELASASEELSSGAQEQAASLEETTATLEEITSTVKQNADNAKQANQVATGSRDTAEKGGKVVADAVAAMAEINESSKNIAEIITTIDEIAFQTNLLALNAAVEAARAGEQGRGFAVVATEVRNLAQRSATSAKEIKRLIQDSVAKVENGSGLVNRSGETLHEIINSVKRVTDIVTEIAAASREQSTGIEQVNKAMIQMDQVTQTNSSQTEELSSTAQSLSAHAQQLQGLVERFRLDNGNAPKSYTAAATSTKPQVTHAAAPRPRRERPHASAGVLAHSKPNGQDHSDPNAFEEF